MLRRALTTRPLSPDFVPVGEFQASHSPQLPLTDNPNYRSDLSIVPLGTESQYCVYRSKEDAAKRSRSFIRCGQPTYLLRYMERALGYGCTCPSFFNSLKGRETMMQHTAELEGVSLVRSIKRVRYF